MKKNAWHYLLFLWMFTGSLLVVSSCMERPPTVTLQRGRELEEQGNYTGALEHYQDMENPGFREICTNNLRYLYGDILDAMLAQQQEPETAEGYFALGNAYYEKARSIPESHDISPNMWFDSASYFSEQREQFRTQAQRPVAGPTDSRHRDP